MCLLFRGVEAPKRLPEDFLLLITLNLYSPRVPRRYSAIGVEHEDRIVLHAFHQKTETLLALLQRFLFQSLVHVEQIDEDGNLRFQYFRYNRLKQIIDGAARYAAMHIGFQRIDGGKENDRDMAQALALADQFGGFEAVHVRHAHIE